MPLALEGRDTAAYIRSRPLKCHIKIEFVNSGQARLDSWQMLREHFVGRVRR
jgi:hypothetical protein